MEQAEASERRGMVWFQVWQTKRRVRMLKAIDICKSYHRRTILKGVSFEAEPGSCIGIAGSNGCGKTTLLSILAGAQKADKGRLEADGVELFSRRKEIYDRIAYVPQENPLIPELTVKDNLSLWYKGNRNRMRQDLEQGPAAMLGIKPMEKMTVSHLSGGMKKRLSLACALSGHAPYLIMDEPGAALDLECKETIRQYVKGYLAQGGTVILTSHEPEELSLCSRIYVLKDGILHKALPGQTVSSLIALFHS
jgi:ABC-2 type transport system ATP-binding protein